MTLAEFQADIRAGIPDRLPAAKPYDRQINHAPKRKDILTPAEKELALRNALRYFPARHHAVLAREIAAEAEATGEPLDEKPVSIAIQEVADGKLEAPEDQENETTEEETHD